MTAGAYETSQDRLYDCDEVYLMGDVILLRKETYECGWKVPKNVDIAVVHTLGIEDSILRYDCPECGMKRSVALISKEQSLSVLVPEY